MARFWLSSSLFAFLAYWIYVHRQVAYNALVLPPLPSEYFFGDASKCKVIRDSRKDALKFCEDMVAWKTRDKTGNEAQKVIASCDPGRYKWNTVMGPLLDPNPRGGLWILHADIEKPYAEALVLENFPSGSDFHPLGIDIFHGEPGQHSTLFVINHQRNQRTIEIFSLYESPRKLVHVKQLSHSAFWAPNSIAALSPNEFFVSIDHWFLRSGMWPWRIFMHQVESVLVLPLGRVLHVRYDESGIKYTTPIKAFSFPNGLSLSNDKSQLAVASTTAGEIIIYDIRGEGQLEWRTTIPTPFLPDNLGWQDDGSLLVAGHPHFPSIARLAKQKQATSPTWLISLSNDSSTSMDTHAIYSAYNRVQVHPQYTIKTIYQSDGSGWSAGTSGIFINDRIIMSGLYSDGILLC